MNTNPLRPKPYGEGILSVKIRLKMQIERTERIEQMSNEHVYY